PAAVVRPLSELYVVRGQRAPKGVFQDIFPYLFDPSPHLPAMLPEQRWPSPESERPLRGEGMWDRTGNIFPAAVVRPLSELYVVRGQRAPKGVFQDIFPYLSIHPRTFQPCCRSKVAVA
ncbi:hypothetical protein ACFCW7_02110, partial [Paenibacillus glucanolyticus]|uniref:hypothetical protein n=1 Tax=Paenibacillus glucanolyticus TaxID=59843 RepID=UPI0035DF9650